MGIGYGPPCEGQKHPFLPRMGVVAWIDTKKGDGIFLPSPVSSMSNHFEIEGSRVKLSEVFQGSAD